MKQNLITLILVLFQLLTFSITFAQVTTQEREVWELEEEYYKYVKSNEVDQFLSLFHENVIGWPALDSLPKGKDKVSLWIPTVHANPDQEWNFELRLLAIKSYKNIVIVHYILRDFFLSVESGREIESSSFKISHTWILEDSKWKIISGMGAKVNDG